MLLAYVDESYTDDWFAMEALLVDGSASAALTQKLGLVATATASAYGLGRDVELHGYEIFHGKRAWAGVRVRARIGVFDDVIEAIAGQEVHVIVRALDLIGQRARYDRPNRAYENDAVEEDLFATLLRLTAPTGKGHVSQSARLAERPDRY
jgi:hypothetical protein